MKLFVWNLLGLMLLSNVQYGRALIVTETLVSLEANDCGDGEASNFVVSFTPNPLIWTTKSTVWIGGRISFAKGAKQVVENLSLNEFMQDLRADYHTNDPEMEIIFRLLNNTKACYSTLEFKFCPTIYYSALAQQKNIPVFIDTEFAEENQLIRELTDYVNVVPNINAEVRLKLLSFASGKNVFCAQLKIKTKRGEQVPVNEILTRNVKNTFDTPKILENGIVNCPKDSIEYNSTCQCNDIHSAGPMCSFKCRFDEMNLPGCNDLDNMNGIACELVLEDYVEHCLKRNNVPILDGLFKAEYISSNFIQLSWKLINFPWQYRYEISLNDSAGSLGIVSQDAWQMEGERTIYNLTAICSQILNVNYYGVDCRHKTYDDDPCYDCPILSLKPFTTYAVLLRLGVGTWNAFIGLSSFILHTTNFTTPEVQPHKPTITKAEVDSNSNFISVDWLINDICPGYIRRFDIIVSCTAYHYIYPGNLSFDCRQNISAPRLKSASLPDNCNGEDLSVTLRIGTNNSMSEESQPFFIATPSVPLLVIIGASLGTFIIVLVITGLIFFYYYKRHVQTYQSVYKTLWNILHIRRNEPIDQSIPRPPNRSLPIVPAVQNCEKDNETIFQTMEGTPEAQSPRSAGNYEINRESDGSGSGDSSTPRDSVGYKLY